MHMKSPGILIIAKKELAGELMPDFSGPDYTSAKKAMLSGDPPERFSGDDKPGVSSDELKEVSDRLMSVAQAQQEQADTIAKMAEQIGSHRRTPSGIDDGDKMGGPCVDVEKKDSIGEAKELT